MSRSVRSSRAFIGLLSVIVVAVPAACSSSDTNTDAASATSSSIPPSTIAAVATSAATTVAVTSLPATTAPSTIAAATTVPPTTVTPTTVPPSSAPPSAPDALQTATDAPIIEVAASGTDPQRPLFAWPPVTGATGYQLVVQTADGVPLWAWTGSDTSVVLGGAERGAELEGPTLTGPSRVRVYALDASSRLVGISAWIIVNA